MKCKALVEIFSRITGFYRPLACWNKGKRQEYNDRVEFTSAEGKPLNQKFNELVEDTPNECLPLTDSNKTTIFTEKDAQE